MERAAGGRDQDPLLTLFVSMICIWTQTDTLRHIPKFRREKCWKNLRIGLFCGVEACIRTFIFTISCAQEVTQNGHSPILMRPK